MTSVAIQNFPTVSVVIPIFNAQEQISSLIQALNTQKYPSELLEIIFVDNGSTDNSLQVLKQGVDAMACRSMVLEETIKKGSYAARNKGVGVASGELLAFTDADCAPAPDWLYRGALCLMSEGRSTILGGRIKLCAENNRALSAVEKFDMTFGFTQKENIENLGFSVTANLMVWREAFESVGLFDGELKSKGDFEWCQRAKYFGQTLVYSPSSVVVHPTRRSFSGLVTKTRRVAGGQFVFENSVVKNRRCYSGDSVLPKNAKRGLFVKLRKIAALKCWRDRFSVALIALVVYGVSVAEKVRLKLGGSPERR